MKKFAVIGNPVSQSISPLLHTTIIKQLKIDASYEKIKVLPDQIKNFINKNNYDGYNVTIPHKNNIIKDLKYLDVYAQEITAVNCVYNSKGYNTDWIGFLHALKQNEVDIKDKSCLIIGAGGAAYAIAFALIEGNAESISVENRNLENKTKLENWILKKGVSPTNINPKIIINCTPLGMGRYVNKIPSKVEVSDSHIVIDTIYNPLKTKWLRQCEKLGARTISGLDMLIFQGIASLNIWLNENIDEHINFKIIKTTLERHLCLQK